MSELNPATIAAILTHLQEGGTTDKETLAGVVGTTARSTRVIQNYLDAAAEEDSNLEDILIGDDNPYADMETDVPTDLDAEEAEEEEEQEEPEAEEEAPEQEARPTKKAVDKKPYRFFFENEDGTSFELERVAGKTGGKVVTFRKKTKKDVVKLMLRGMIIAVDIIQLAKLDALEESVYPGTTNGELLNLALAAK